MLKKSINGYLKLFLGIFICGFIAVPPSLFASGSAPAKIGFNIHLQPYLQPPVGQVIMDLVAFSNEPAELPILLKEVKLFQGSKSVPFATYQINLLLKSLKHAELTTETVNELIFPHPLNSRRLGISQENFFRKYGNYLIVKTYNLNLTQLALPLYPNETLQIRAEALFVSGGKPEIHTAATESTCIPPLTSDKSSDKYFLGADSYNGWYRTDAHIHTDWSDGNQTIAQATQAGFNTGLSTVIITDHGDCFDPEHSKYKGTWEQQRSFITNNTFAIPTTNGEEVTEDPEFTTSSHYLAYDLISWVYNDLHYNYGGGELYNPNEQPLVDAVNANNPPFSCGGPAHPGLDVYPWNGMEETGMTFMEVFDAIGGLDGESMNMWDEWNAAHLNSILYSGGPFICATANSDSHNASDVGKYSTYFYAPAGASPASYFNALRNRKTIASQTPSFAHFTLNGQAMGSVIDLTNGQNLNFNFTHIPRGYNYNYVSRVLIILNDSTNNPRNINLYPSETATTSNYTLSPGNSLYPIRDGYYRVSVEFRHKTSSWGFSSYSWTICQPVFFRFH